jgi:hypothetical protein
MLDLAWVVLKGVKGIALVYEERGAGLVISIMFEAFVTALLD